MLCHHDLAWYIIYKCLAKLGPNLEWFLFFPVILPKFVTQTSQDSQWTNLELVVLKHGVQSKEESIIFRLSVFAMFKCVMTQTKYTDAVSKRDTSQSARNYAGHIRNTNWAARRTRRLAPVRWILLCNIHGTSAFFSANKAAAAQKITE